MPTGHYNDELRCHGEAHHKWKHGKYVGEHRTAAGHATRRERNRQYYREHVDAKRDRGRKYRAANRAQVQERGRRYWREHPEVRARARAKRRTPEGRAKRAAEWQRFKVSPAYAAKRLKEKCRKHGITVPEYIALLAKQQNRCAICQRAVALDIDHDHKSKVVRGLLCRSCNSGVSHLDRGRDWLTAAFKYLGLE